MDLAPALTKYKRVAKYHQMRSHGRLALKLYVPWRFRFVFAVPQRLWEEKAMIDGYTKTLLTVIAALLFILAIKQIVGPASAQIGSQCGYQRDVPCYIMIIPSPNPTL
jgi:hypothetical protein